MLAAARQGDRRSTLGPSLASTAGSSVSVAASTKRTATMIPRMERAGLGTSITAESDTTVVAETRMLAGRVHRRGHRVNGLSPGRNGRRGISLR